MSQCLTAEPCVPSPLGALPSAGRQVPTEKHLQVLDCVRSFVMADPGDVCSSQGNLGRKWTGRGLLRGVPA